MSDNTEGLLKQVSAELVRLNDEIKAHAEKSEKEVKAQGELTGETKKVADDLLIKNNALQARFDELEQQMARRGAGPEARKSVGERFIENEEVKAFMASNARGTVRMQFNAAITSLTTDADGSAGDLIVPDRQQGILGMPQRRMTVRDLLTPGRTNSNAIQYVQETGFTNNAAVVAEGVTKPESTIKFDLLTKPVATIAHWVPASNQILSDAPMLQSYVDGRLRYGLEYVEELQLLMGSGASGNLQGIYTAATAYSAPITIADATSIDQLRLAMLQAFLAEYPATGIVLHPTDWTRIELTKTDEGAYLFAKPQDSVQPRLWGLPVVETQAMTIDKFLVGAFKLGAQIFDRQDAIVEVSTEDSDNFRKNMVTIRAEERIGLAIYRPESFIKGDMGQAA